MITKVIDSNQGCKEFAKNLLENLFSFYLNLGSELVENSMAHLLDKVTKVLLLKYLEMYKVNQDLILPAHSLAAKSEPLFIQHHLRHLMRKKIQFFKFSTPIPNQSNSSVKQQTGKSDIRIELDKYLSTVLASSSTKILEWWRLMGNTYLFSQNLHGKFFAFQPHNFRVFMIKFILNVLFVF